VKFVKLWAPVILWAGLIFYLSAIPDLSTGLKYDFLIRKIGHITEYFVFASLLFRAFKGTFNLSDFLLFIYPASLSVLYAISDEIHQLFVRGRNCSLKDILIDTEGIFGFFVVLRINRLLSKAKKEKV